MQKYLESSNVCLLLYADTLPRIHELADHSILDVDRHLPNISEDEGQALCGFISFAFDHNEARLQMDMDHNDIPRVSDSWHDSLGDVSALAKEVEKSMIGLRNEAGMHVAELCCGLIKNRHLKGLAEHFYYIS